MADNKKDTKIRIILLVVIGALAVYSLVMWYFNYHTLERAVLTVETAADDQSKNFRHYVKEYKVTKVALDEAKQQVANLTEELQAANTELTTARNALLSVQQMNDQLKQGIQELERYKTKAAAKGEALEGMINVFKQKNKQLDTDLQLARKELSLFQPEVGDTAEGRAKIARFKDHIRMVKKNMNVLKEQAQEARIAAQKERDRLEMLYGNNGYLVKDGKNVSQKRQGAKVDIKVEFK
jgi:chromosome segregation ATPase